MTARHWHKPVDYTCIGERMQDMWGADVQSCVVTSAKSYVILRRLFELYKHQATPGEHFDFDRCHVEGWLDFGKLSTFVQTVNSQKQYICNTHKLELPVTFLNSCLLLNLHSVQSMDDPVQVAVRENILSCAGRVDGDVASEGYVRNILRGLLVIHATRRYEFSSCLQGKDLSTPDAVISCFTTGWRNPDLRRRPTSEGIFHCGTLSEAMQLIGRSNVLDTFPGGEYQQAFEEVVRILQKALREATADTEDISVLDPVWTILKNWRGFGGKENEEGKAVRGFIAKNIVFQGLRNVLHVLGFRFGCTTVFVSGPNPVKLASVYHQCRHPRRGAQQGMYSDILDGIGSCALRYGSVVGHLRDVDSVTLQDNLCKAVEVLQTVTTGRLFGKGRLTALDRLGAKISDSEVSASDSESEE